MIEKPKECCPMGSYQCQVPMPIKGRRQDIDLCIADIVAALNAANIITEASCCGHGKIFGSIILEDGRSLIIKPEFDPNDFITERPPIKSYETLQETEKRAIQLMLKRCKDNRSAAAKRLGIGERTLYRKIREYGLKNE